MTGKADPKTKETFVWFSELYFVLMSFFFTVITKRKNTYNNHKKGSLGESISDYYDGQTITTQHKYLLTAKNERYKNEHKENKRIWNKEKRGIYEYNKRLRGQENVAFQQLPKGKKSQHKSSFLAFFLSIC